MLDIVACLREPPGWVIVFNTAFNNITVILWLSFLLVEETRVPGKNHLPAANHRQTLSHNVLSSTPRLRGIRTHTQGLKFLENFCSSLVAN